MSPVCAAAGIFAAAAPDICVIASFWACVFRGPVDQRADPPSLGRVEGEAAPPGAAAAAAAAAEAEAEAAADRNKKARGAQQRRPESARDIMFRRIRTHDETRRLCSGFGNSRDPAHRFSELLNMAVLAGA